MAATGDDDDSWLYGAGGENHEGKSQENEENNKEVVDVSEDQPELITVAPVDENEVISDGEVENGGIKDDGVVLIKNEDAESKLDHVEEGMMESDMLDDGANAVLDESLGDGELHSQEEGGSDDDDSDDDVQVTIGDIKAIPSYGYGSTPVNLNIKRVAGFGAVVPSSAKSAKGLDIDAVGNVNGVPLYDFNLDTMEDKPWRKPGADITDYFNYGFNEDSWKIYCERQRKLRLENNVSGKISVNHVTGLKDQLIPVASVNENSKYSAAVAINLGLKKAGPPPGRKLSGSIDVIGGGAPSLPSRRPVTTTKENVITVMTGRKFDSPLPGIPPPHLAPTHLPPPSFLSVPPEANLSIPPPPPGVLPPTNIPPPPPGTPFTDHFASSRYSVPPPVGGPMYEDHAAYYNGSTMSHGGTYDETTQQSWPSSTRAHSEAHRERDRRERSRERDHERSYTAWDYREHETRDRERGMSSRGSVIGDDDYERSSRRHREYHERSRDRERDRERERSTGYEREYERDDRYDRDRERDRRHKDHRSEREDRHRERSSRRRHHHEHAHESDEEYEHRSSRHKHKRSKRDKDDETSSNAPPSASESQDATELDLKQE